MTPNPAENTPETPIDDPPTPVEAQSPLTPDSATDSTTDAAAEWIDVSEGKDAPNQTPSAPNSLSAPIIAAATPEIASEAEKSWWDRHKTAIAVVFAIIITAWLTEAVTTRRIQTERAPLVVQNSSTPSRENSSGGLAAIAQRPVATPKPSSVLVHIVGRVRKPGVYALPLQARVKDLVRVAGGALPDADLTSVNLAARLEDGAQIRLLELPAPDTAPRISRTLPRTAPQTTTSARRVAVTSATLKTPRSDAKIASVNVQFPLDINRASALELEALPGIGPALAGRIVAYRNENGAFNSVDDLDEVKGIGEKLLAKMRPLVVVR